MGTVYKVLDKKIGELVALKLIRPELAAREKTLERFKDELRLARKITHKNVCRMHDLNEHERTAFITMEYISGENLKSMIRMMGVLSPSQSVYIARQACEGLAEAHRLGIVHRDLKSRNIMVDHEGNARIMDFGLARSMEEKGITEGKVVMGTPEYMSPEQVEGLAADARSDIYALGVSLFEMATGRLPFEGETAISVAVKHKTVAPPDPRKLNPQIPENLSRLILKCLEKDPAKRYQSAEELLADLDEIEKELPSAEFLLPERKTAWTRRKVLPFVPASKRLFLSLIAAAVVIASGVLIWRLVPRRYVSPAREGKPSLAVLYFKNNTGDEDLSHWQIGLSDEFISRLQKSSQFLRVFTSDIILSVLQKLSLDNAKGYSAEDLKKAASRAGASHLLIGFYSKAGDKFRIHYELKDGKTGEIAGSGDAEGRLPKDFYAMVDKLANEILGEFKAPLQPEERRILTASSLAEQYFRAGRHKERQYVLSGNSDDLLAARESYERSIREDPNYALPYWGLGDIHERFFVRTHDQADRELMLKHYQKAYDLDSGLAETNAGMGWAYFYQEDFDKAYAYFKKALEIEPQNPWVNYNVGSFLKSIGLPDKATHYYSRAIELGEPTLNGYRLLAYCQEASGQAEEAVASSRKLMESEPDNLDLKLFYARMLVAAKRWEDAEREIGVAEKLDPRNPGVSLSRALILAARGEKEKALAAVQGAESQPIYYSQLLSRFMRAWE
jgi:serine/threonine protein kinase/Tfp pilus assembly protein PilF